MSSYRGKLTKLQRNSLDVLRALGNSVRESAKKTELPYYQVRAYAEWRDKQMADLIPPPAGPKILVFDIENAPINAWVWSMWKTNVIDVERDWYLLCFAYGWYDLETSQIKETGFASIHQDPKFKKDTRDDSYVLRRLHKLLDQADIVIGHNSDSFDLRKVNDRVLQAGQMPPSPYQTIDTLKESRRYFGASSHSLKNLSRSLKITLKETTEGFQLWRDCMRGDAEAWGKMESYNRTDVKATAELYTKLRPWIGTPGKRAHPNLGLYIKSEGWVCTNCGNEDRSEGGQGFQRRGYYYTTANRYQKVQCNKCSKWSRLARAERQEPVDRADLR